MRAKYGRLVAVLIDEYDAPILARLSDKDLAEKIRDAMGDFYNALKAAETSRGFTLVTGITRFARTSVFSKLNNPVDLTLNAGYAGICGLTLEDLDLFLGDQLSEPDPRDPQGRPKRLLDFISRGYFPPGASEDDLKSEILERYDGYSWDGETRVLNPWSVFSVFDQDDFSDFWLNTGQPRFLSELAPEDFRIHEIFKTDSFLNDSLNSIDVGSLAPVAILFQTGYLTVASREVVEKTLRYYMRFPNLEVETAAYRLGLGLKEREAAGKTPILRERAHALLASLTALDPAGVQAVFGAILASLPYNIHSPNEGYCKTVFLLTLGAAGQRYESESMSGDGIADVVIRTAGGSYYVIEFKYVKNTDAEGKLQAGRFRQRMEAAAKKALSQIEGRKYAWKFKGRGRDIWKVALVVGRYSDTLAVFEKAAGWRLEQGPGGDFTVVME
jgi:hypothetical protein